MIRAALLTLIVCWPVAARAQVDPVCDPQDPQSCVQQLTVGTSAPFSGLLLSYRRAATMVANAEQCSARVDLVRQEEKDLAAINATYLQGLRENDRQAFDQKTRLLEQAAVDARPSWYDSPALWFGLGVVSTVVVVVGAAAVLDSLPR